MMKASCIKLTSFLLIALTQIQPALTWETEGQTQYTAPTWEPCYFPYFLGTRTGGGRGNDLYGENHCGENPIQTEGIEPEACC
jgi:hypothetical protein